jgi:hypothetical protein
MAVTAAAAAEIKREKNSKRKAYHAGDAERYAQTIVASWQCRKRGGIKKKLAATSSQLFVRFLRDFPLVSLSLSPSIPRPVMARERIQESKYSESWRHAVAR